MRRPRGGVTLVELCVALAVLGLAGGLAASLWLHSRRAMHGTSGALQARGALRVAAAALAAELRGVASGDLYVVQDSVLDALRPVGTSVVCSVDGPELVLPPTGRSPGPPLTRWSAAPRPGDVVLVRREDATGSWARAPLVRLAEHRTPAYCPASTGYAPPGDAALPRPGLVLASLPAGVGVGGAVWVGRRVRYSLYRGGDGRWQLGRRECAGPPPVPCEGVQPVAGPLLRHERDPARSGLHAELLDGAGRPVAPGDSAAALLRVILRAPRGVGRPLAPAPVESVTVWLALRNRP